MGRALIPKQSSRQIADGARREPYPNLQHLNLKMIVAALAKLVEATGPEIPASFEADCKAGKDWARMHTAVIQRAAQGLEYALNPGRHPLNDPRRVVPHSAGWPEDVAGALLLLWPTSAAIIARWELEGCLGGPPTVVVSTDAAVVSEDEHQKLAWVRRVLTRALAWFEGEGQPTPRETRMLRGRLIYDARRAGHSWKVILAMVNASAREGVWDKVNGTRNLKNLADAYATQSGLPALPSSKRRRAGNA
jgi:hypothetical protein